MYEYPLYTLLGSRGVFYCAKRMVLSFRHVFCILRTYSSSTSFFFVAPLRSPTKRKRKQRGEKIYRLTDELAYRGVLGPVGMKKKNKSNFWSWIRWKNTSLGLHRRARIFQRIRKKTYHVTLRFFSSFPFSISIWTSFVFILSFSCGYYFSPRFRFLLGLVY